MSITTATAAQARNLPAPPPAKILYMEDDLGLARLLKRRLASHGYVVDIVADGEEGVALVEEESYDAVLVDYSMPVMSGIEVVRHLAQSGVRVPMIMVTGNGDEKVAVEAMKLGATDYLVKDVDMRYLELLPLVLEKVLVGRRLSQERERVLQSIGESEERYRKLVELSPDGIVICSRSRIEFANPAALRLLGAERPDQVLGELLLGFVHPASAELFQAQLELIESSGVNVPWLEERFVRLDYGELAVEVSGIPFNFRGNPAVQIIFRDITARVEAKQLLERMAYYDQLTRLPNRALFFDRLRMNLSQAKRYGYQFALLYLDLDSFKEINDTRGHDQGDLLLSQAAARLESCARSSDTVSRMGGDEFIILMARINRADDAAIVARKVLTAMTAPFDLSGERCVIGGSIGISIYPDDAEEADALVKKADMAMYKAKQQGGNNFLYFSELRRPQA
jgi:diguanylate cyclase (GGDEF)-like protein/PAS domain S-box-containing protein